MLRAPVPLPVSFFISSLVLSISLFIFLIILFSYFLCFVLGVTLEGIEELELECLFLGNGSFSISAELSDELVILSYLLTSLSFSLDNSDSDTLVKDSFKSSIIMPF